MPTRRPSVAVIGGGIFGASVAIELARSFSVSLFDRGPDLLLGATYANHNRHHYGFHYPRSSETAEQCLTSRASFENLYGKCLDFDFDNYYAVAKSQTKTSASAYLAFCQKHGLEVESKWPTNGTLDKKKIAACLKVKEGVYDIDILRKLIKNRIQRHPNIKVFLHHDIVGGEFRSAAQKKLNIKSGGRLFSQEFDVVVNATYGRINTFCEWFGFPKKEVQFNLQELDVIELPIKRRIGITIQDGPFPSFVPMAHKNQYLLAHVNASQLVREVSSEEKPLLGRVPYVESNWQNVLQTCAPFIPLLHKAVYIKSIFVDRVVDSSRMEHDDRLSEIADHGKRCWSVFSAKVITCVSTAQKLHQMIQQSFDSK